jgi:N-acetylmuramoyl-L-alanine amidase
MSKINKVTVHITASNDNATIEQIRAGHIARGFTDIGYHWLVDRKGVVHKGRSENLTGAHVAGYNTGNIGISYIARGSDTEPNAKYGKFMTPEQQIALEQKVADILYRYDLSTDDIYGHNDFNKGKACPCFQVSKSKEFLDSVQKYLDETNGEKSEPEQAIAEDGEDAEVTEEPKEATKI